MYSRPAVPQVGSLLDSKGYGIAMKKSKRLLNHCSHLMRTWFLFFTRGIIYVQTRSTGRP